MKAFLRYLYQHRVKILVFNGVITIGTLVYLLFIIEPWYRSTATAITSKSGSGNSGMLSAISGNLPFNLGSLSGSNVDRYLGILNSRRVADSVIKQYDLKKVYELDYMSDAYEAFRENMSVIDHEDNTFSIVFDYKNEPAKAAEIANYIYDVLYQVAMEVQNESATNYKKYLKRYLDQKTVELRSFEDSLSAFQQRTQLIEPQIQSEITLEALGELQKELILNQISLDMIQGTSPGNQSKSLPVKLRIKGLKSTIDELRNKTDNQLIAVSELPELGLKYARLFRSIEVNSKVVEFLRLQYEQSVLEEQKQTIDIQLLSKAVPADRKARPKRAGILLFIMALSATSTLTYYRVKFLLHKHSDFIEDIIR